MDAATLSKITHGLYVLGASDEGALSGATVDAVMQGAMAPPILCVSCMNTGYTGTIIEKTNRFCVNILGQDIDPFIICNFGFQSSRSVNKWDNVQYHLVDKMPVLDEALGFIICDVISQTKFDSHTVFMGKVINASILKNIEPVTYTDYQNGFKNKVIESFQNYKKGELK